MKWSHYLVTGSEGMKQGYVENYQLKPDKVKVMPNWINLERFKFKSRVLNHESGKTILFVHWLSKRKGADMIIPILKKLVSNSKFEIRNSKFTVIGGGPYKEQLLQEIENNNLQDYIEVLGAIPNKNLPQYYARADVLIMPSMEEGFPRVLLEAMASGLPYVATDVGAVREMSPEIAQRFLIKPGDIDMFAHKIEILLNEEDVYKQFQGEELRKIKNYSLEKIADEFLNLFL
jgi:glycosyltransferase involved in cell wall biosynthesis